jgi:hypothetical protein
MLHSEVIARDWHEGQQDMEEMAKIYEGELPARFEQFFPKSVPKHLVQVVPLAWDDLATQVGRLPDLRGEPKNKTRAELKAVGLLEKIGFSYLRTAQPSGKIFMKNLAWWLQIGRAVAVVTPDVENQRPSMELRDPRTVYPGIKKSANNSIIELSDLLFKYELDLNEARKRGLAPMGDEKDGVKVNRKVKVLEFIDEKQWLIVSEHGMMQRAVHDLGVVPGWVFQTFAPNSKSGKSRFKDQVALMVAISRLITAKIAYADRLVNPILWTKGHEAALELGPYTINRLGPNGEMGQIDPPAQFQVDRDIQMLNQFSRILNRNPEVRQGEISAKGSYTSAKTLEQLSEAIDTVVGSDWDVIGPGMERLLRICFTMDAKLWPKLEKTINGTIRGKKFSESYTPGTDIGERVDVKVDYGFGVGGYQGFLMHLQAGEAKTMSRRRVMEAMPGIHDVDEELSLIEIESMDEAGMAMFQQQAAMGQMDMRIWSIVRKDMAEKGLPLFEAIIKYEELLAEQAMEAQGTDQGALMAPHPEEEMMEEAPLPGIPPGAMI